jgi:hypothetical protein
MTLFSKIYYYLSAFVQNTKKFLKILIQNKLFIKIKYLLNTIIDININ